MRSLFLDVLEASSDLSRQSESLRLEVSKFLTQVRGDSEIAGATEPEQEQEAVYPETDAF